MTVLTLVLSSLSTSYALGLGEAQVRSALEQPLNVNVALVNFQESDAVLSCVKARIESVSGDFVATTFLEFVYSGEPKLPRALRVTSKQLIREPAIKLFISWSCGTKVERTFNLLFDLVDTAAVSRVAPVDLAFTPESTPVAPRENSAVVSSETRSAAYAARASRKNSVQKEHSLHASPSRSAKKSSVQTHSVLKLSGDDISASSSASYDLKLSSGLTMLAKQNVDERSTEEIKRAQQIFAARLRDEDPLVSVQAQLASAQKKIAILQQDDAAEHAVKRPIAKTADGVSVQNGVMSNDSGFIWLLILAALLLISVGALAYVVIRLRRQQENSVWWEAPAEQKVDVEEIVNGLQVDAKTGAFDPSLIKPTQARFGMKSEGYDVMPKPVNAIEVVVATDTRVGLPLLEDTNSSTFNFFSTRGNSVNVEEISDVTQEAEFWMSVNDPHRAIEILEPQGMDDNPDSPVPWLYLLDLYKLVDNKVKFDLLKNRFKTKFNAHIPLFEEILETKNIRHLEDYHHLVEKLCGVWFTNDALPFLESLLVDDRAGERVGFELPVYRDILLLIAIANELERSHALPRKESVVRPSVLAVVPSTPTTTAHSHAHEPDTQTKVSDAINDSLNFELLDFKEGENGKR